MVATGAAGAGEVVARSAARSPSPHAPGARMTVVTQIPLNYAQLRLHGPSEADLRLGMNLVNFYVGASSQLARIATISGRPAKSRKKVVRNICVFLSQVDRTSFSLSTGAS